MHVQHVRFNYPKSLRFVTMMPFSLVPGKLNVLIGMNGAGKTTLFDCMTGALPITSGGLDLPDISDILYLTQFIYYSDELKGKVLQWC